MSLRVILRILGLLLMLFSLTMLVPVAIAWVEHDSGFQPFLMAFGTLLGAGFILWLPARSIRRELRLRDGFMVVVLFWFVLGLAGAVPLYLAVKPSLGLADAVFESLSGLTTTGATVITNIEELPASLLMYRQLLQWLPSDFCPRYWMRCHLPKAKLESVPSLQSGVWVMQKQFQR